VSEPETDHPRGSTAGDPQPYVDTWVVLPTYNEASNVEAIGRAILDQLPGATLLVVDDGSPDGTGQIAEAMAADGSGARVRVLHRSRKAGLGPAYLAGFSVALEAGAGRIVQIDADWSHDPSYLQAIVGALAEADLVIGSRYVRGGGIRDWGLLRRVVSRGGSIFARAVLGLVPHDLTGGFKAWRSSMLGALPREGVHAGGYVFQIEMTFLADRLGARIAEVPIVFTDRVIGQSKMSRRIVVEALFVVLQLRFDELRGRGPGHGRPRSSNTDQDSSTGR
jgi:dolichol-phosphate mannosyltransferase